MQVAVHLWPVLVLGAAAAVAGCAPRIDATADIHAMSTRAAQDPSPAGRAGASLAYDPLRREMLLFGGVSADRESLLHDLWAWNGTSWRRLIPSDGIEPRGRAFQHLVYDAARRRMVMFGGRRWSHSGTVEVPGDVWEWDGTRWHEVTSDTVPMLHAAVVYEPRRQRVVAFGGASPSGPLRNVMEWDGRRWHRPEGGAFPGEMRGVAVTAATPVGELLALTMRSVGTSDSIALTTWTWNGSAWARHEAGPFITEFDPTTSAPDGTIFYFQQRAPWLTAPVMHTRSPAGVWSSVASPGAPRETGTPAVAYDSDRRRFVLYGEALWEWDGARWEKRR